MGDNNDEIDMNDVVVAQPASADKNELIMQLMQQIAKMRVEMQRIQGAVGHDTENCSTLKHKIQNMINNNLINIEENHLSG